MGSRKPDRLRLEAEVLFYLWREGALSLSCLVELLRVPQGAARAAVSSLMEKSYIYKIFEPPGDESGSVYYLTSRARSCLDRLFRGEPRYRLRQLWFALKREETKVPRVRLD